MKSLRLAGLLILALMAPAAAAGWTVTDAARRTVAVSEADTRRIVSIGPAVTEVLFALGLGDRIVAVDQTSLYPPATRGLPNVGYMRALAPEGVLSADPSLILIVEGAGPPSTLDVLERASVPVVIIPDATSPQGVAAKIEAVAAAVGKTAEGRALATAVSADFATVAQAVAGLKERPRAVFVLSAASGAPVVGGAQTGADAMLRLAGAENPMAGLKGYKPAVDEAAYSADPQVLVVMSGGGQALSADLLFGLPAFRGTQAARDGRLVSLPGAYLLGFGPRTPQAVRDLAAALHPGVPLPALPERPWAAP